MNEYLLRIDAYLLNQNAQRLKLKIDSLEQTLFKKCTSVRKVSDSRVSDKTGTRFSVEYFIRLDENLGPTSTWHLKNDIGRNYLRIFKLEEISDFSPNRDVMPLKN